MTYRRMFVLFACVAVLAFLAELGYRRSLKSDLDKNVLMNSLVGYSIAIGEWSGVRPTPKGFMEKKPEFGHFEPNTDYHYWSYTEFERLLLKTTFHSNNFGLISRRDYTLEKADDEYRIIVFGQEQTASATANISWPDHLEDALQNDDEFKSRVGKNTIKVINFGQIDGSFGSWSAAWRDKAKKFNPDLVVINFLEFDFHRPSIGTLGELVHYQNKPVAYYPYTIYVDGKEDDWITATLLCNQPAVSLADPHCSIGLSLGVAMSPSVGENPAKVRKAITALTDEFTVDFWSWRRSLLLQRLTGTIPDPFRERQLTTAPGAPQLDAPFMISYARDHARVIKDEAPATLLLHAVYYSEYFVGISDQPANPPTRFPLTEGLSALDPDIRSIDMRQYIPFHKGAEEAKTWWLYPAGSEKWNDHGTKMYGKAVAEAIKQNL